MPNASGSASSHSLCARVCVRALAGRSISSVLLSATAEHIMENELTDSILNYCCASLLMQMFVDYTLYFDAALWFDTLILSLGFWVLEVRGYQRHQFSCIIEFTVCAIFLWSRSVCLRALCLRRNSRIIRFEWEFQALRFNIRCIRGQSFSPVNRWHINRISTIYDLQKWQITIKGIWKKAAADLCLCQIMGSNSPFIRDFFAGCSGHIYLCVYREANKFENKKLYNFFPFLSLRFSNLNLNCVRLQETFDRILHEESYANVEHGDDLLGWTTEHAEQDAGIQHIHIRDFQSICQLVEQQMEIKK